MSIGRYVSRLWRIITLLCDMRLALTKAITIGVELTVAPYSRESGTEGEKEGKARSQHLCYRKDYESYLPTATGLEWLQSTYCGPRQPLLLTSLVKPPPQPRLTDSVSATGKRMCDASDVSFKLSPKVKGTGAGDGRCSDICTV